MSVAPEHGLAERGWKRIEDAGARACLPAQKPRGIHEVAKAVVFAGIDREMPEALLGPLAQAGLDQGLTSKRVSYAHHYPLFCRRVLPDDTMISMPASAPEPMYSISVFNYDSPRHRQNYYNFCAFLADALRGLMKARLHWGNHFAFEHDDVVQLYPRLDEFRELCCLHDRNGALRDGYTKRVLNLSLGPSTPSPDRTPIADISNSH